MVTPRRRSGCCGRCGVAKGRSRAAGGRATGRCAVRHLICHPRSGLVVTAASHGGAPAGWDAWHPGGATADDAAGMARQRTMRRGWDGRIVPRVAVAFDQGGQGDLAGSAKVVAGGLTRLLGAGANGLVLSYGNDPDLVLGAMQTAAREVLPRLREQR